MEEIIKEVENKGIERVVAEVKEVEAKPKKPRSQAQKEAFERARQKRAENLSLRQKKKQEEEDWGSEEEGEVVATPQGAKKEVKIIKPPPAERKRGRPRKVMKNQEPPYQSFVSPPDPQLYTQHYPIQGQPFPWNYYYGQQQQQPVVNNYYYGEQHNHQLTKKEKEIVETPHQPLPVYEPEPSPENSGDEYDYDDVVMPQSQLKYRFA